MLSAVALSSAALLASCAGILGIEEIEANSAPDDAGSGGGAADDAGSGGAGNAGGSSGDGGAKVGAGGGGPGSGGKGAGGGAAGGTGDGGGGPVDGGNGGASDGGAITVSGKIIDVWKHAVPSAEVTIGDTTVPVETDGTFTIGGVSPPYDVAFTASTTTNNQTVSYAYVYVGLSRSDPTLQVHYGVPDRSADISITFNNTFPIPDDQNILVGVGGVDGADARELYYENSTFFASWVGPTVTAMTAHALRYSYDPDDDDIPIGYTAYDSNPIALEADTDSSLTLDLGVPVGSSVASGLVSGTITRAGTDRRNYVWVRFNDGTLLPIVEDWSAPNAYSYLVPTLPQASITVAASSLGDGLAMAFKGNVAAAGQTNVDLELPTPPRSSAPADGARNVGSGTAFRWTGGAKLSVLRLESEAFFRGIYVITTEKNATLPTFANGYAFDPGDQLFAEVQNHGDFDTVDDAAGPEGYMSPLSTTLPHGASNGSGFYAVSPYTTMYAK